MKNLISIIFMGLMAVMLTGCAFGKFEQSQENSDIQVFKANDGYIQFTNKNQIKNTTTYVNGYRNTWEQL